MEVNETNCPLTETPMEQPIEAPVPTVEDKGNIRSQTDTGRSGATPQGNQREKRPD